jgi:hypothetical protein
MAAVGGRWTETSPRDGPDSMSPHQPPDPAPADLASLGAQGSLQARATIAAMMTGVQPPDIGQDLPVGYSSRAVGTIPPGVAAGSRDAKHAAGNVDRPSTGMGGDDAEPHLGVSEKMPMAFF